MTSYDPGDRVRVTFEGVVDDVYDEDITVVGPDNRRALIDTEYDGYTVEKLTPDYEQQVRDLEPGTAFAMHSMAGPVTNFIRTKSGFYGGRWDKHEDFTGIAWQNVSSIRVLS